MNPFQASRPSGTKVVQSCLQNRLRIATPLLEDEDDDEYEDEAH